MLVKIIKSHDDVIELDLAVNTLKQVLNGVAMHCGNQLFTSLMNEPYRYILMNKSHPDEALQMLPEFAGSVMDGFDTLFIIKDIDGEIPVALVVAYTGLAAGSYAAVAVTALINIALSFAVHAVMSLLSPTPEFSNDPSKSQSLTSNLFNGSVVTREQGGIVPLVIGQPYCSGVLISSGVSTEDY